MATTPLTLYIDSDYVSLALLSDVLDAFIDLLRAVDRSTTGLARPSLQWPITQMRVGGSAYIEAEAEPEEGVVDFGPKVVLTVIEGLAALDEDHGAETRAFSADVLDSAYRFANLAGNEVRGFRVTSPTVEQSAYVAAGTAAKLRVLAAQYTRELGVVEGTVEAVDLHGRPTFTVYDAMTKRAVRCDLPPDRVVDILRIVEKRGRVVVSGMRTRHASGLGDIVHDVTLVRELTSEVFDIDRFVGVLGPSREDPRSELQRQRDE